LQLKLLGLGIEEAQVEETQTDFWHRLVPQVHFSASLGGKDILFPDPPSGLAYTLPRDAWRIFLTLSVSDLFDASRHRAAALKVERAKTEYDRAVCLGAETRKTVRGRFDELNHDFSLHMDELVAAEDLIRFNELRFQQGKIGYDVLLRSKLEILALRQAILGLTRQIRDLK
jgi:hypothetical protein